MTDEKLPASRNRMSRRTVLKLTGAGAAIAWTTPIISSVRMPAFAASTPCDDPNSFTDTFETEGCGVPEPGLNNFSIVQGSVDIIGGSCGNQFVNTPSKVVDLSGTPLTGGCAGSDAVIETAPFPAGTYQFQFDLGGSQRGDPPNTVVVSFGTFAATPFTVASGDPLATQGPFTAVSGGSDALRFDQAALGNDDCIGALLDNVIVRRCS